MWQHLSEPCHATQAESFDASTRPLAPVLAAVAACDYARLVFGHWSHSLFVIGTAPSYAVSDSPLHQDIVMIESDKDEFVLGYGATPTSEWGLTISDGRIVRTGQWIRCDEQTAVTTIGRVVRSVLAFREPD